MKKNCLLLFVSLICWGTAIAQTGKVTGTVIDKSTGQTLPFANVLYGEGKGVAADLDGKYILELPYGDYTITVSYTGFAEFSKKITVEKPSMTVDLNMDVKGTELKVFEVSDYAIARETPVAVSNIGPATLETELASQDLPMVLNSTPGAYATAQGGGDGDARITIRGFNQRNVAVMIDGIPVNDMENGWVFWSNWFGLDAVTRTMQVQRGLGASKIAIPSVGGTINIMTKGIDNRRQVSVKQEVGNNGFLRTSLGLTSGKLKNGFGITAAGSYKQGDGWVDNLHTKGYFYYLKIEKIAGKHLIALSAMGAPQEHGQRSFKQAIPTFDMDYAESLGINREAYDSISQINSGEDFQTLGLRYNRHWGYVEDYVVNAVGDTTRGTRKILNERINYYHKPQFTLRDLWQVNDRLYISNMAYLSIGSGGGTGAKSSIATTQLDGNGQIIWQDIYDANSGNAFVGSPFGDLSIDQNFSDTEHKATQIIRASINNHFWYGLLSSFTFDQTDSLSWSGGIDLRSYKGEHYRTVYDLVGGDYYISASDERNQNEDVQMLRVDDKFGYHNDGLVRWGGAYGQVEYKTHTISAFGNLSFAYSGYKRVDYFKEMDVVIDDKVFSQAVDFGGTFYYDPTTGEGLSAYSGAAVTTSGDTVFVDNVDATVEDGFMVNPTEYTINSPEARSTETEWKYIPGFTIKTGMNYNMNEYNNIFFNLGYISKAQRFQNIISNDNEFYEQNENELIQAFEVGFSRKKGAYLLNLNSYITRWQNKPGTTTVPLPDDPDTRVPANINGMDALHMGIELESGFKPHPDVELQAIASIGDWSWISEGNFIINDPNTGNPIDTVFFNAKGIKVGDAAQTQFSGSVQWDFLKNKERGQRAYLKARYTYFDRYFADFDPLDYQTDGAFEDNFDADGNPFQSWEIPSYGLLDIHLGYSIKVKKIRVDLRGSIINALDEVYISDATNNDKFNSYVGTADFDAGSSAVFFGQGRRFNTSLRITF